MTTTDASFNYGHYLQLDQLLSLQGCVSNEHDETLFIIIHQVYELWFKQMLHEADALMRALMQNDTPQIMHCLRRMCTILKTMVGQIDILETMTPLSFASFRDRLQAASGFQSQQFRQLELLLGMRNTHTMKAFPVGSALHNKLKERSESACIFDGLMHYLFQQGYAIPEAALNRDYSQAWEASPPIQDILIGIYRQNNAIAQICERLVDLDEGMQEWRYRHVQMVQRTIGVKIGTGGSAGAEYLRKTLFRPFFPDLWEIRSAF